MDGQLFEAGQIDALSKYPTRGEAQATVVQLFLSPARKIAGQIASPAGKLAGYIKAIEEKLEKGEAIAKV
jgi:ribosomal protein L10